MTKKQLAAQYGICVRTLTKWIEPFVDEIGTVNKTYMYTPEQVKLIYLKLGEP